MSKLRAVGGGIFGLSRRPFASLGLALVVGACIVRTAPPPGGAPAAAAPSPATEAAEERIAGLPRVDLLGGAGAAAFHLRAR